MLLGGDTTAASEEALLQRAKLKAQDALKSFFGDDRQADSDDAIPGQAELS